MKPLSWWTTKNEGAARGQLAILAVFAAGGLIWLVAGGEKKPDAPLAVPPQEVAQQTVPAIEQPVFVASDIEGLIASDDRMARLWKRSSGPCSLQIDEASKSSIIVWAYLPERADGEFAEAIGVTLTTLIVKDLVRRGMDPSENLIFVRVHVASHDAPESVTGKKQTIYFGKSTYDFNHDRVEWSKKL